MQLSNGQMQIWHMDKGSGEVTMTADGSLHNRDDWQYPQDSWWYYQQHRWFHRDIEQMMTNVTWQEALIVARQLDPLAPIAGQLAYVCALEHLQGWLPPEYVAALRETAIALERTQNMLWWLVRFAQLLADTSLIDRAYHLAADLSGCTARAWRSSPFIWIEPQQIVSRHAIERADAAEWRALAQRLDDVHRYVERSRSLVLRTRGVGVLTREHLETVGVHSGPIFQASNTGNGDVLSLLLARLQLAIRDVLQVCDVFSKGETIRELAPVWDIPEGVAEVTVEGPRGAIGLHLVSQGGRGPTQVEWQRPSVTLLQLLPYLLRGQKLADAEVILASLDLAMADADG